MLGSKAWWMWMGGALMMGLSLYLLVLYWKVHGRNAWRSESVAVWTTKSEFTEWIGNFQCNKYPKAPPMNEKEFSHPQTMMGTCKFENLCMTTSGEFVLFKAKDRVPTYQHQMLRDKPWVYTQGRIEGNRGLFSVRMEDGDIVLKNSNGKVNGIRVRNHHRSVCSNTMLYEGK